MNRKLVYGVGLNDVSYSTQPIVEKKQLICIYYQQWRHMLERCYSEKYHLRYKTYKNCTVCDDWLIFSNFKDWMESQDWEGKQLDKDILIEGNKHYSPETCVFVDQATNSLFTYRGNARGQYPLGVCIHPSGKFMWQCGNGEGGRNRKYSYSDPLTPHHDYLKFKITVIEKCAVRQVDYRVKEAILIRCYN